MTMNNNNKFTDEYFNLHYRTQLLGQGGQGLVFRTTDPDVALKILTDADGAPLSQNEQGKRYVNKLQNLRLLPIPDNLNLATPASLLKGKAGYLMPLLNDMGSLSQMHLDGIKAEQITEHDIPPWLEGMPVDYAKHFVHYYQTGGLRRRLLILSKFAGILARIHGAGLIYGDISPENVFVSSDVKLTEVWLIDADNMQFERANSDSAVYTSPYGAPEMVQRLAGCHPRTDCHAFAVVAFELLSMCHPFVGALVEGNNLNDTQALSDDWANTIDDDGSFVSSNLDPREQAYAGLLPWIDDNDDDSNINHNGIPRSLILTPQLKQLFQRTFGIGRTDFWQRPSIYHWPIALAKAADSTLLCPNCQMSYFYDVEDGCCPYCKNDLPDSLSIERFVYSEDNTQGQPCWTLIRELSKVDEQLIIPERVLLPFSQATSDTPTLKLIFEQDNLKLEKTEDCQLVLSIATITESNLPKPQDFKDIYHQQSLPKNALEQGFCLIVSAKNNSDLYWLVKFSKGTTNGAN